MLGEELAQLGAHDRTGVAEELFAELEQVCGDLFRCNAEVDIEIVTIRCWRDGTRRAHGSPPSGLLDQVLARVARAWAKRYDSVPVSMMLPPNVKRSTPAAAKRTKTGSLHDDAPCVRNRRRPLFTEHSSPHPD